MKLKTGLKVDSVFHSAHWGLNPPKKHHPPLNQQKVQAPLFRQSHRSILVLRDPPLLVRFFSEPKKYYSFSSLTKSYLLKVTKFLVKSS